MTARHHRRAWPALLARRAINIGRNALRQGERGRAIPVPLRRGRPVDDGVLKEIAPLPNVISVKRIDLS